MMYLGDKPVKAIMPLLPNEYQEVEYIESTGTQYIDTGVFPTHNFIIKTEAQLKSNTSIFGCYSGEDNYTAINITGGGTATNGYVYYRWGNQGKTISLPENWGGLHLWVADKNTLYLDGKEVIKHNYTEFTSTRSMYIFARNTSSVSVDKGVILLKKMQIYDGKTLLRNFIPCYRKSDNVIGLYDTVNKSFYTNKGTGTFLKGENKTTTQLFTVPIKKCVGKNLLNAPSVVNIPAIEEQKYYSVNLNGVYTLTFNVNMSSVSSPTATFVRAIVDGKPIYNASFSSGQALSGIRKYTFKGHLTEIAFLNWCVATGTVTELMLNEGDPLPYEPYREWYEY